MSTGKTFLSVYSGIGGIDAGLEAAGWRCAGQIEVDPFCQMVLEKHWPHVPRFKDVRDVATELVRYVCGDIDLIAGGFACQDVSAAGKGAGIGRHTRSGLTWRNLFRLIRGIRPVLLLLENVPALRTRGYDRIARALERIGYRIRAFVVGAEHVGAPHRRHRVWIVGYSTAPRCAGSEDSRAGSGNARANGCGSEELKRGSSELGNSSGTASERHAGGLFKTQAGERSAGQQDGNMPVGSESSGAGAELANHSRQQREQRTIGDGTGECGQSGLGNPQRTGRRAKEPGRGSEIGTTLSGTGSCSITSKSARQWDQASDRRQPRDSSTRRWQGQQSADLGRMANPASGKQRTTRGENLADASNERCAGFNPLLQPGKPQQDCVEASGRCEPRGLWPSRPGQPQHDWEAPRLTQFAVGSNPDELSPDVVRAIAGTRGCTDGEAKEWYARNQVKISRRQNKEALKAYGNSVCIPVVTAIGRALLPRPRSYVAGGEA